MIYVVINSKGGVGKSTFANQILPSYFFDRNNEKTRLIEIDDENNDSVQLSKSDIVATETINTNRIKEIDEIFIEEDDVIIDVGGNKTATVFLREMEKIGVDENITWFIPVGQGLQDTANALDTYHSISELNSSAKIVFVLSNSNNNDNDIEWEYLHFFGSEFLDTPFAITKHIRDFNYIVVKGSEIINNAKTFNKTVFDISQNNTDFKKLAKEAKEKGEDTTKRKYLFLHRIKNQAKSYIDKMRENLFPELDKILEKKRYFSYGTLTEEEKRSHNQSMLY